MVFLIKERISSLDSLFWLDEVCGFLLILDFSLETIKVHYLLTPHVLFAFTILIIRLAALRKHLLLILHLEKIYN